MLLVYWRDALPGVAWEVPQSPSSKAWLTVGSELLREVSVGGVDLKVAKENLVPEVLARRRISRDLKFQRAYPRNVFEACRDLLKTVPPVPAIVYYDYQLMRKGRPSGGGHHANILLEDQGNIVRVADPANRGPESFQEYSKSMLQRAMAGLPPEITFFIPRKLLRVQEEVRKGPKLEDFNMEAA